MIPLPKKAVTEEDVKATEARIGEALAGLKKSVVSIPSEAVRPVTDTVKEHPYITVAAAAGAGFVIYSLLRVLIPRTRVIKQEVRVQPQVEIKEQPVKGSFASRILSEAVSIATPYITGYVQTEMSRIMEKKSAPPEEHGS